MAEELKVELVSVDPVPDKEGFSPLGDFDIGDITKGKASLPRPKLLVERQRTPAMIDKRFSGHTLGFNANMFDGKVPSDEERQRISRQWANNIMELLPQSVNGKVYFRREGSIVAFWVESDRERATFKAIEAEILAAIDAAFEPEVH